MKKSIGITIADFARNDRVFNKACELARIKSTRRQASKFLNKKGLAYSHRLEAAEIIKMERN